MSAPLRDWDWSAVTVKIGAQLLAAEPDEPLRVEDLVREVQQPIRSVRALLDRLHSGRMITRAPVQTGEPGRPAWGYWLADHQRPAAQRAADTPEVLRQSRRKRDREPTQQDSMVADSDKVNTDRGSVATTIEEPRVPAGGADAASWPRSTERGPLREVVIVDVEGSAYGYLLETLSETRAADAAAWVARVGDEVVFVFDMDDAAAAAGDLLAVLTGARLSVRSASVREVIPTAELIARARRMAPEIRRARSTRDAHDAPQ